MKIGSIHYQFFIYKSKLNSKGTAPIYCRLYFQNEIKLISTTITTEPQYWDIKRYAISYQDDLNSKLLEIWKGKLQKILLDIYSNDKAVDLQKISDMLKHVDMLCIKKRNGIIDAFKSYANSRIGKVQPRTIQKYITVMNSVAAMISEKYGKKDIPAVDLKNQFLIDYEKFAFEVMKYKEITLKKSVEVMLQVVRYLVDIGELSEYPWTSYTPIEIPYDTKSKFASFRHNIPGQCRKTYLMKDNHSGLYKIGRSKTPGLRENTLQSEKPDTILVKTWDENIEKILQTKYHRDRKRGEWFSLTPLQVRYICTHY